MEWERTNPCKGRTMAESMFRMKDGFSGNLNPYTRLTDAGTQVMRMEMQKSMATLVYAHFILSRLLAFPLLPLFLEGAKCGSADIVTW